MTLQSDVVPWPLEVFVSSRHGLFVLRFQKPSRKQFAFENIGCLPSDLVCRPRLAAVTQSNIKGRIFNPVLVESLWSSKGEVSPLRTLEVLYFLLLPS